MKQRTLYSIVFFLLIMPSVWAAHALGTGGVNPNQITTINQPVSLGFTVANDVSSQDPIVQFNISAPANVFFTGASVTGSVAFSCASATSTITCANATSDGLANATFLVVTASTLVTADGTYPFTLTTLDKSGGQGTLTYTLVADSTGPNITITYPEAKAYAANAVPITLNAGSDAVQVWYALSGTNTTYSQATTQTLSDGNHTLVAYAKDSLGNTKSASVTFSVDATPPAITILQPQSTLQTKNDILVNVTVSDGNGVNAQSVFYRVENSTVNGSWQTLTKSGDSWSGVLGIVTLAEGQSTIRVTANDSNGNSNTQSATVTKDTTVPVMQDVQAGSITWNSTILSWTTDDAANMTLEWGATASFGSLNVDSNLVKTRSVPLSSLSEKTLYYYRITGCDQAGNCATTNSYNFTTAEKSTSQSVAQQLAENIGATTTVKYDTLTPGSAITYPVEDPEIGLKKISFMVQKAVTNAALTVNQLKNRPETVTTPDRTVYKYFEVVRTGLQDDDLANVKVFFTVSKTWLQQQGAKTENVRLLRFKDGWQDLPTRLSKEGAELWEFEADSPGFSVFAIVAQGTPLAQQTGNSVKQDALAGTGNNILENGTHFENLLAEKATKGTSLKVVLVLAILGLIGVGGYYFRNKIPFHGPDFTHEHKHTPLDEEGNSTFANKPNVKK